MEVNQIDGGSVLKEGVGVEGGCRERCSLPVAKSALLVATHSLIFVNYFFEKVWSVAPGVLYYP